MANVINRTTKEILISVNTPDYDPIDWIINPTFPVCEEKYYKIVGDEVQEMNTSEKAAVDQAEADALALAQENAKDIDNMELNFKTLAMLSFQEINKLRVKTGDSEYTWDQFKISFKNLRDTIENG